MKALESISPPLLGGHPYVPTKDSLPEESNGVFVPSTNWHRRHKISTLDQITPFAPSYAWNGDW